MQPSRVTGRHLGLHVLGNTGLGIENNTLPESAHKFITRFKRWGGDTLSDLAGFPLALSRTPVTSAYSSKILQQSAASAETATSPGAHGDQLIEETTPFLVQRTHVATAL